jgi:hypothetical protein
LYIPIIGSTSFLVFLARLDVDLAREVRGRGCPHCGGPLDTADYPRKPRGGPADLPEACKIRRSLCCRRDGCRTRRKPPSVLFLDRRVYLASVVVLISALAQGATPRRMRSLRTRIGASAPTIARWQEWWRESFPATDVGRRIRARIAGGLDEARLPRSLLEQVPESLVAALAWVLAVLAGLRDP